jgi:hypothetical protein
MIIKSELFFLFYSKASSIKRFTNLNILYLDIGIACYYDNAYFIYQH